MDILIPGLRASVTHIEYASGVGSEFQELYITTIEGKVMKRLNLPYNRKMMIPVDKVPVAKNDALPVIVPDFTGFFPGGKKVPVKYLEQIVQFFKAFMKSNPGSQTTTLQHSYEAMAHIVWNPTTGYRVAIPKQIVSGAHVSYEWDHLQPNDVVLVDIHSHNTMGAFFSGTDNGDDVSKLQFSGVIGQLDKPVYATKWRFNDTKQKYEDIKLEDIFEAEPFEVPKAWMDQVTIRGYQYHGGYQGGYQGGYRGNRGHYWDQEDNYWNNYGADGHAQNRARNSQGQFTKQPRARGKRGSQRGVRTSGVTSIFARKVGDPLPLPAQDDFTLNLDGLLEGAAPVSARGPLWFGEDDITIKDVNVVPSPYWEGAEKSQQRFIRITDDSMPVVAWSLVLDDKIDDFVDLFQIPYACTSDNIWVDKAFSILVHVMEDTNLSTFSVCVNPEPEYETILERVYIPVLVSTAEKNRLENTQGRFIKVAKSGAESVLEVTQTAEATPALPPPAGEDIYPLVPVV